MRECRPLGTPRRSGRELDIGSRVKLERRPDRLQGAKLLQGRTTHQIAQIQHPVRPLLAETNAPLQPRQLGNDTRQNVEVATALEPRRQNQRPAARLAHRVFQLAPPISRVEIDQDQSGLGRRELRQYPLDIVL